MKTFLAIIIIFAVVIGIVYQTGYLSGTEPETPAPRAYRETPRPQPARTEEPKPEVKVVYVPQVVEKVYIKEVVRERIVEREIQRPAERTQPVYQERPQPAYRPQPTYQPRCNQNDCCVSYTGLAQTRCFQYLNRGYTCQQYQQLVAYYNPQIYGGRR